jgi:hypothetical protein
MTQVKDDVTRSYLAQLPAGYTKNHVDVTLSAGSVVANVVITPLTTSTASVLETTVTSAKSAVQSAVVTKVKSLPNINTYLNAGTSANDLTAVQETVVTITLTTTTATIITTPVVTSKVVASQAAVAIMAPLMMLGGLLQ